METVTVGERRAAEYEAVRQKNIQERDAILRSLQLPQVSTSCAEQPELTVEPL